MAETTDVTINKIVIHELIKEQHAAIQPSNIRPNVIDPTNVAANKLLNGIISLYGKRNNSAHYGTFRTGVGRGDFPDNFETYSTIKTPDNIQFLEITTSAMNELYRKAEASTPSSGGYILFADYSKQQGRFFLAAMIKQKEGLTISENLEPEEFIQLDLSKLHQAARINFGKLSAYLAADSVGKMDLSYLSFVSPRTGKTAAGYFVTALGCAPGVAASRATDTLIRESIKFFRENEDLQEYKLEFKKDLLEYLHEKEKFNESVKLSEIEKLARKYIPAEQEGQADEIADAFISYLNSEDLSIPVEFPINKSALTKYTHIKYKADNWELNFERQALGDKDDAQIYYDKVQNRLIINDLPEKAATILAEELARQKAESSDNVTASSH